MEQEHTQGGTTDNGTGQTPPPAGNANAGKFTQEQLDAIVQDRLTRQQTKFEADQKKAVEDAVAAVKQEQTDALTQAQARIKELEPLGTQVETLKQSGDRYQAALTKHLDTARTDLPDHIKGLLDKLDVVDQLDWLATNQEAIRKPVGAGMGTPPRQPAPSTTTETQPRQSSVRF